MIQGNVVRTSFLTPGARPFCATPDLSGSVADSFKRSLPGLSFGQTAKFSFYYRREEAGIFPVTIDGFWLDSELENLRLFVTDPTVFSWLPELNYGQSATAPEFLVTIDPQKNTMTISRNPLGIRAISRVAKPSAQEHHRRLLNSYRERIAIVGTLARLGKS